MSQIKLAVICDYLEENWHSMDLCAQMLFKHLQIEHAESIQATQVCPKFVSRFQKIPQLSQKCFAFNSDRIFNRFWDYPRYLQNHLADFDFFHVTDHSYAQLVHVLPPEKTGVFCHDIDAFRSLIQPEQEPRPFWYRAMSRKILSGLQKAAVVFYSTNEVKREIERYQLANKSCLVQAPYGISSEYRIVHGETEKTNIPDQIGSKPFILHVGSCIPRKRIDILLEVFAGVRDRFPDLHLIKVSGEWTQSQQQQISQLGIGKSIIHLLGLERQTIAALYQQARAVLLTSEAEGFGLPVIEALACGAIVIASDIPVLQEVGGSSVVYCPIQDISDISIWVQTVTQILANPSKAPIQDLRLARAKKFSWSAHTQIIAQSYLELNK